MSQKKWVYRFGEGALEGHSDMRELLGNKGANLAEMASIGLPVPPGFTITTDACRDYLENDNQLQRDIAEQIETGISWLESVSGRRFGDPSKPLLVSVRSGAAQSMPGMMDTVLNLGLNDETVAKLLIQTRSKRFILDCYRRLIEMYGTVVLGLDDYLFDDIIHDFLTGEGLTKQRHIDHSGWAQIIESYKTIVLAQTGKSYPQEISRQLYSTIGAVFHSWYSPRAISYRTIQGLVESGGTAVTVQLMVYGNRSNNSASGVAFTRDPSSGEPGIFGEYLPKVQGEDIVGGSHSARALSKRAQTARGGKAVSLQEHMPRQYEQLGLIATRLESRFRDMQEVEFTIEEGKLWLLQTRAAKRTIEVAIRIALDLLDEGLITRHEVLKRVPLDGFHRLTQPVIDQKNRTRIITRGLPASPGAASGTIVFSPEDAIAQAKQGKSVILVRNETIPNDVAGMHAARAILTRRGGISSHAADIARSIGRPCVVDARFIELDLQRGIMTIDQQVFNQGDEITIDGSSGLVLEGRTPMRTPKLDEYGERFKRLLKP